MERNGLEEEIIGALLNHPMQWFDAANTIDGGSFATPFLGEVFRAIGECARIGPVTLGLVETEVRLPPPDGITLDMYLANLAAADPDISVRGHVEIIAERAKWRGFKGVLKKLPDLMKDESKAAEEVVAEAIQQLTAVLSDKGDRFSAALHELMMRVAEEAASRTTELPPGGVSSGLETIERLTGPWLPGELIVLGADSGAGKTALATQIGIHVGRSLPVDEYQLEMSGQQVAQRVLAGMARVSSRRMRSGFLNVGEGERVLEAARRMETNRFHLHWRPGIKVSEIRTRALARRGREGQTGLIIADHSKLIRVDVKTDSRVDRIARAYEELKEVAKEAECPVLVLPQVTRESRKNAFMAKRISELRPSRDGLYGGGDPVEFADIVYMLHRPARLWAKCEPRKNSDEHDEWVRVLDQWQGKAEIILDKFRGGPEGDVGILRWNGPACCYEDDFAAAPLLDREREETF